MDFLARVADYIQSHQLLKAGQPVVTGVSGGPDSVCLLDCLVQLGYHPIPVYINHQLRPEAEGEGQFVSRLAESYGLQAVVRSVDVPGLRNIHGGSLEDQARRTRYQQLIQVAQEQSLDTIATAHQVDDQIETVLLNFLRGSGLAGLRGMKPSTDMTGWYGTASAAGKRLVRPLLSVESRQIHAYLESRNLAYLTDASNTDMKHRRNRIRHELVPYLQTYNPQIRANLLRLSKIMADQAEWVEDLAAECLEEIILEDEADQLIVDPEALGRLPDALQRELLRIVLSGLQFADFEPDYELIQASFEFIQGDNRHMTLPGGVKLERVAGQVIAAREGSLLRLSQYPQMPSDAVQPLPFPGEVELAGSWKFTLSLETCSQQDYEHWRSNSNSYAAAFDLETLPADLTLRARRRGDRMQPLGMQGTIKLSDLFINAGVPQPARDLWPIVASGENIIWVPGLRMAESYKLKNTTTRTVIMRVSEPADFLAGQLDSA